MKHIFNAIMVIIVIASSCDVKTQTLCVHQANNQGFGDVTNHYAWSMTTFKGSVYVATLNAQNAPEWVSKFYHGEPFVTNGTNIYKGDMDRNSVWRWDRVVSNGNGNHLNYGVRKLAEVGNYLYGVTGNHVTGFEIWRTINGRNRQWQVIMAGGFGDVNNLSGRGLGAFNGYLYVGVENRKTAAKIFRRQLAANGDFVAGSDWEEVVKHGLGYIANFWFSDFIIFNGYLYAGTLNGLSGMQLWRTLDGINYENIFVRGNGYPNNTAVMKLYVYNDKLYFGTMNFDQGSSLWVNKDGGGKTFIPVFTAGNGNRRNAYVWYMNEYHNRLYVGTFAGVNGRFNLFSSAAPGDEPWIVETQNGFGYAGHYGIRSMTVIDNKLMIGSATADSGIGCLVFADNYTSS